MSSVATYLNFPGTTAEAFAFYKSVFGTEYRGPVMRMGDSPQGAGLSDEQKKLVMHVALPITAGHVLMGTDSVESMGHSLTVGNNFSISIDFDTVAEAERIFAALAEGGKVAMPLQKMFWGAWWGSCTDRFGVQWMANCQAG